ncbi:hypothetical protein AAEX37_01016 [Oligella sp. MSHR50489EDL]|uniref:baseplate assembly protein n=1 Tax=Oligella sp. MSHR50489EDL TaxID=3139409 RepID=UPI003D816FBF
MTKYFNPLNEIDLSLLPKPNFVEEIDYEQLLEKNKSLFLSNVPADIKGDVARTLDLESEPITILLQVLSYKEMYLRQRVNDAARATMLAFAEGSDLDHIGATSRVKRKLLQAADLAANPPIEEIQESDNAYRKRIQLSPESYTSAGPYSAYMFYALSADSAIKDISITRPKPGDVAVYVMSHTETGKSTELTLSKVSQALNAESIRPLNDTVLVNNVSVVNYSIDAEIVFYADAYQDLVYQAAIENLEIYIKRNHLIGRDITRAGIIAALKVEGVQDVVINTPDKNIEVSPEEVAYCEGYEIKRGGGVVND